MAKKISNSLVTLSSAAILAVYAAGYQRTTPAADRFATELAQRHAPTPNEAPVVIPPKPAAALEPAVAAPASSPKALIRTAEKPRSTEAPLARRETPSATASALSAPPEPAPPAAAVSEAAVESATNAPPADSPQIQSLPSYKDGVFLGWGYSRHGNIQAFVRIEGGRIVNAGVQRCETRWPCDLVAHLPGQVIARQSADVDYVTGATQSGDAFYGAITAALKQAR